MSLHARYNRFISNCARKLAQNIYDAENVKTGWRNPNTAAGNCAVYSYRGKELFFIIWLLNTVYIKGCDCMMNA